VRIIRFIRDRLLDPVMWWTPTEDDPLRQNAWQRGKAHAAASAKDHRLFHFLWAVIPAAITALVIESDLVPRLFLTLVFGAIGYCLVPLIWAAVVALKAPTSQRNEARGALGEAQAALARHQDEAGAALAAERRRAEKSDLQARLVEAVHSAERSMAAVIDQVPEWYPDPARITHGPQFARRHLCEWIGEVTEILSAAGWENLAADFRLGESEPVLTRADMKAAYEARLPLLNPLPDLRRDEPTSRQP
jgi:hypothetical protein